MFVSIHQSTSDHKPIVGTDILLLVRMMVMNQEFISTVGYTKNRGLTQQLLLLLLVSLHLLLSSELHYFPVWIRVLCWHKCGARSGSVLRHQPTRFVTDATSIAQSLWTHGSSPPLWCLLRSAMKTFTSWSFISLSFLRRNWFWGFWLSFGWWIRWRKEKKAGGPIAGGSAGTFASSFSRDRDVRGENWGYCWRTLAVNNGGGGRWTVGNCGGGYWSSFRICIWRD